MLDVINTIAWVGANILIAYIATAVVLFVVMYYVFFDPKATTAGRMIFRFMLSLVGVTGLVFIGIFIDPAGSRSPFSTPHDVEVWRPLLRLTIYGYVAFTITTLAIALIMRKWFPHKVKKSSDLALVKPRHDTEEIPIIKQ
jgi:hypothetical protein